MPVDTEDLFDALQDVSMDNGVVHLPFDPDQVIANLVREMYVGEWRSGPSSLLSNFYYFLRPILPVSLRRHLQRFHLRDWSELTFPRWPVDCSVDNLLQELLLLCLRAGHAERIPFIWFWPNGHSGCVLMTHDVETKSGIDFCGRLMDIDDSFGIKSSFQVIPEERYEVDPAFLAEIRRRGFEVCVHDLNHDGHLYKNREQFLERAAKIDRYRNELKADGFRSGALYRKQLWYDALKFSFDMSVPNVAHLDPQRGGCCTVMPYFLNSVLEIPVTTIQDYSMFHIIHDYSIDIWKQQTTTILANHGLMSFIVHPDYIRQSREQKVYEELLAYLSKLRRDQYVWFARPSEINEWWRQRSAMQLIEDRQGLRIEGPGSERARIAYAREQSGKLMLSFDESFPESAVAGAGTTRNARK